jgi:hypothetical protein
MRAIEIVDGDVGGAALQGYSMLGPQGRPILISRTVSQIAETDVQSANWPTRQL